MMFGPERTERILGLGRNPCRACTPRAARLVTRRRWAFNVAGLPLIALDARWRRCTGCPRRFALPRLSLPTVVTASLIIAFLMGLGLIAYGALFAWTLVMLFWGVWLVGFVLDVQLDKRLVPVPPSVYRPQTPRVVKTGARRRATQSVAKGRPVGRWRRSVDVLAAPLRLVRGVQALRQTPPRS